MDNFGKFLTFCLLCFAVGILVGYNTPIARSGHFHKHSYDLIVTPTDIVINDKERVLDSLKWGRDTVLDNIILDDNQ